MANLLNEAYLAKEKELFDDTWNDIRAYCMTEVWMAGTEMPRIEKLLDYNCKGGKMTRAKTITRICEIKLSEDSEPPAKKAKLSKEECPMYAACVLGWCLEICQAYLLVMDDIMDHSETRRFQPCWYKLPDVGVGLGIVDASLLRSFVYTILKKFLSHKPYYLQVLEMFNQTMFMTEVGQMLDTLSEQRKSIKYLTEETYMNVVRHKTCYYTFHLPLAMGLVVSGDLGKNVSEDELKEVAFAIGEYFQIQDDVMDCYSDPKVIGKIGTDIQDFKCSWLAVTFVKNAIPEQMEVFKANYGKDDEACIAKIKGLYNDMNVRKMFEELEEEYGKKVGALIPKFEAQCPVLKQAIEMLWKVTYKRKL